MAFHFRFIMPGEWRNDITEAVGLLLLVLNSLRDELSACITTEIRLGKLFYTQYLGSKLETMWREACFAVPALVNQTAYPQNVERAVPLDRIFVVSLSDVPDDRLQTWHEVVMAVAGERFLFSLVPNPDAAGHRAMYFGGWSALVGRMEGSRRFVQEFGAVEYEPELSQELGQQGIDIWASRSAIEQCSTLF